MPNEPPLPMPLLDIAPAQASFKNNILRLRAPTLCHHKFVFGNEKRLSTVWKSLQVPEKEKNSGATRIEMQRSVPVIRAVATLEPSSDQSNGRDKGNQQLLVDSGIALGIQHLWSSEDSEEVAEREKLRRRRISKANKGKEAWNKGRKHSAETVQRIRERTRLAMQDPKIKMKLTTLGHAQSTETRLKIGAAVRKEWERRREKMRLQVTCCFEWQNLIAEASKRGFVGEEELQINDILNEQFRQEWLESSEQRSKNGRLKGSKNAPKSDEHRRKISEAIAAKWTEPGYRDKVCSGLSKYFSTSVGVGTKPWRRLTAEKHLRRKSPAKQKAKDTNKAAKKATITQNLDTRSRKGSIPSYSDPLASSKLEMIMDIRARRAAVETKKTETIEHAKLLIAEAEKAAKALEAAAMRSPLARSSLIETRKLIAEAIHSIQSIEAGQIGSHENMRHSDERQDRRIQCLSIADQQNLNGFVTEELSTTSGITSFGFDELDFQDLLNSKDEVLPTSSRGDDLLTGLEEPSTTSDITNFGFDELDFQDLLNGKDEVPPTRSRGDDLLAGPVEPCQNPTGNNDYGMPPSDLHSSFIEKLTQLGPNGNHSPDKKLLPNGDKFWSRKEGTSSNLITVKKKWVRGKLVEMVEGD